MLTPSQQHQMRRDGAMLAELIARAAALALRFDLAPYEQIEMFKEDDDADLPRSRPQHASPARG